MSKAAPFTVQIATPDVVTSNGFIYPKSELDKIVHNQPVVPGSINYPDFFNDTSELLNVSHNVTDFHYDEHGNLCGRIHIHENEHGEKLKELVLNKAVKFSMGCLGMIRDNSNVVSELDLKMICAVPKSNERKYRQPNENINTWILGGKRINATHMLVVLSDVTDAVGRKYYPVYVISETVEEVSKRYTGLILDTYNLNEY